MPSSTPARRPRDGAVHAEIVGADGADGREGVLATEPEADPFGLRGRDADRAGAVLRDAGDRLDEVVDLGARAVEFDDHEALGVAGIAAGAEGLGGVDRGAVHHLHAAGNDAGGDDPRRRSRRRP